MRRSFIALLLAGVLALGGCLSLTPDTLPAAIEVTEIIPTETPPPSPTPAPTQALQAAPSPTPSPTPTPDVSAVGPLRFVAPMAELGPLVFVELFTDQANTPHALADEVLYRLEGDTWVEVLADPPGDLVGFDGQGRLWAFTAESSHAWQNDAWQTIPWPPTDPIAAPVNGFTVGPDGAPWVGTPRDVRTYTEDGWQVFTYAQMNMANPDSDPAQSWSVFTLETINERVWVGECTYSGPGPIRGVGVRWFDGGAYWFGNGSPGTDGCVTGISAGPGGRVWLDAGARLLSYNETDGLWQQYGLPAVPLDGNAFGEVLQMPVDADGSPWPLLSICGGASCFGSAALFTFDPATGWDEIETGGYDQTAVHIDSAGDVWLFLPGGLFQVIGDETGTTFTLEPAAAFSATLTHTGPDGTFWVAGTIGERGGLWAVDP